MKCFTIFCSVLKIIIALKFYLGNISSSCICISFLKKYTIVKIIQNTLFRNGLQSGGSSGQHGQCALWFVIQLYLKCCFYLSSICNQHSSYQLSHHGQKNVLSYLILCRAQILLVLWIQ